MQNKLGRILYARNLREHDLARRAGLTQGHLNRIKNGRVVPSLKTALRICAALGLSVDEVFGLDRKQPVRSRRPGRDACSASDLDPPRTLNAPVPG
jgi:transcriptional regulator with XRE-family HTH domain